MQETRTSLAPKPPRSAQSSLKASVSPLRRKDPQRVARHADVVNANDVGPPCKRGEARAYRRSISMLDGAACKLSEKSLSRCTDEDGPVQLFPQCAPTMHELNVTRQ